MSETSSTSLASIHLGDALAVLGSDVVRTPDTSATKLARDQRAQEWLQSETGRHDIAISRRESGRPRLKPPYPELAVSLSTATGSLAVAFSPTRPVGVDIELANDAADASLLARDHFAKEEADFIASEQAAVARDRFYRLWVAKEAALKIIGRGVFDGLAKPNLADKARALLADGAPITTSVGADGQAVTLVVQRVMLADKRALYLALARAD